MTRLRTTLLLVLLALGSVAAGQLLWPVGFAGLAALEVGLGAATASVVAFARSVPEWAWWAAFGSIWWLPCVLGKRSWSCGARSCPAAGTSGA